MSLYLCVDCGGSKTSAVVTDVSGNIVGRALGGPSNFAYLGIDAFVEAVRESVSNALKTCVSPPSATPVPLPPASPLFAAAWFGVSGVDSQAAIDKLLPVVSQLLHVPISNLTIGNDTNLLAAPLQMHEDVSCAVACIAGTGGIVVSYLKTPEGKLQEMGRVGGWGWILGDEGGGFHVGREAVRQILMRADVASVEATTLPHSVLQERILQRFGLQDVFELLTAIHLPDPSPTVVPVEAPSYASIPREKRLSSLAPLVFESAFVDKDPLALSVLHATSAELVDQICILLRSDERAKKGVKAADGVICFGGSLVGVEDYRNLILEKLKDRGHVFRRVEFIDDAAAVGARGLAATSRLHAAP